MENKPINEFFVRRRLQSVPLEHLLKSCDTYEEFAKKYADELLNGDGQLAWYLAFLLDKYDKKASVVSTDAGQAMSYVGNIINGKKINPSRNVLLRIAITIGADFEETQQLLKVGGCAPLYVRRKQDVIIWFGIMKKESLDTISHNLEMQGFEPLIKM